MATYTTNHGKIKQSDYVEKGESVLVIGKGGVDTVSEYINKQQTQNTSEVESPGASRDSEEQGKEDDRNEEQESEQLPAALSSVAQETIDEMVETSPSIVAVLLEAGQPSSHSNSGDTEDPLYIASIPYTIWESNHEAIQAAINEIQNMYECEVVVFSHDILHPIKKDVDITVYNVGTDNIDAYIHLQTVILNGIADAAYA